MTATSMAITQALRFVVAGFLLIAPSMLSAQVPTSGMSKADSAISQVQDAAKTNESAEIAQKLTNPLAAMISVPIQNWFDFNLGPRKDGIPLHDGGTAGLPSPDFKDLEPAQSYDDPSCLSAKCCWPYDPNRPERLDGEPLSFPGTPPISHLGSWPDLLDTDRHQWAAQHAQVRRWANGSGAKA